MKIPILNASLLPDTSGNVFPDITTNYGFTNSMGMIYAFKQGANGYLTGFFQVPKAPASSTIYFEWTANAITGNVVWQLIYKKIASAALLDVALATTSDENVTVVTAAPGTAKDRVESSISLTNANFTAGDIILFQLGRNGANASDTMAAAAVLLAAAYDDGN